MNATALRVNTSGLNQSTENRGEFLRFIFCASRWRFRSPALSVSSRRKRPVFISLSVNTAPEFHPLAAIPRGTTLRPDSDDHNTLVRLNQ
jgi:hypothetical protein